MWPVLTSLVLTRSRLTVLQAKAVSGGLSGCFRVFVKLKSISIKLWCLHWCALKNLKLISASFKKMSLFFLFIFWVETWFKYYYYWSLLYSAILSSRADSLRSHVILHEWITFYSAFLNIHRSGVLTELLPQESAAISAHSVYTVQPCTVSLHAKPHT